MWERAFVREGAFIRRKTIIASAVVDETTHDSYIFYKFYQLFTTIIQVND